MNSLETKNKLKKQFWLYGVFPLVTLYVIGIITAGYNLGVSFEDCFITQSCSSESRKGRFVSATILKILMFSLTVFALWNVYKVFKLSREGVTKAKKIRVRIYVILFPVIAIIASPFLALSTNYYLTRSAYYYFIDYFVQKIPMSLIP